MNTISGDERDLLLGSGERWDGGELARVFIAGISLSSIEAAPTLLALPWPVTTPSHSSAEAAHALLSKLIAEGDDPNLRALRALTDIRKPMSRRLTEVAEIFGNTTSRSGRNRLRSEILPWFLDHLAERLRATAGQMRDGQARAGAVETRHPLADPGKYRVQLTKPIEPTELGDVLKGRLIQIALDVNTVDDAVRLAQIAAAGGADMIEVGDPIIKRFGMGAVTEIRNMVPGCPIVVEFASSDWVDEQVEMAADAGGDIIFVLGLDHPSRIERAVRAARGKRVGIVLAMPSHVDSEAWCSMVESAGVDAISLIRNIDSAEATQRTTAKIREVSAITDVPLVISGGFAPHNIGEVLNDNWSVVIVGGSFINSRDPESTLRQMQESLGLAS